eukprot:TRINITY_DN4565_c0_g1_i1.p1 TRINITY_DN4565_c0_g1~~TRINITY_DN4565_c0_g1_i1.p1  ORF type:complete len:542 (+),score=42.62 TRINITY_DN4565_c0_g1_i1:54-1679(+)
MRQHGILLIASLRLVASQMVPPPPTPTSAPTATPTTSAPTATTTTSAPTATATWVLAAATQSCDTACGNIGQECDLQKIRGINHCSGSCNAADSSSNAGLWRFFNEQTDASCSTPTSISDSTAFGAGALSITPFVVGNTAATPCDYAYYSHTTPDAAVCNIYATGTSLRRICACKPLPPQLTTWHRAPPGKSCSTICPEKRSGSSCDLDAIRAVDVCDPPCDMTTAGTTDAWKPLSENSMLCPSITELSDIPATWLSSNPDIVKLSPFFNVNAGTCSAYYISNTNESECNYAFSAGSTLHRVCACTGPVPAPSPAGVGGDPVTVYNGKKTWFWLPEHVMVPLLEAPDLDVHASVFWNGPDEQWFDRVRVTQPIGGRTLVEVSIKRHALRFNSTRVSRAALQSVDVAIRSEVTSSLQRVTSIPSAGSAYHLHGIQVALYKMSELLPALHERKIGDADRECVVVNSQVLQIDICSAPANEYIGTAAAIQFAHLDIFPYIKQEVATASGVSFGGLLPEIWGLREMSNVSRSYLQKPSRAEDVQV